MDQALAKLWALEAAQGYFERGEILRIGETGEETHGAGLQETLRRSERETAPKREVQCRTSLSRRLSLLPINCGDSAGALRLSDGMALDQDFAINCRGNRRR